MSPRCVVFPVEVDVVNTVSFLVVRVKEVVFWLIVDSVACIHPYSSILKLIGSDCLGYTRIRFAIMGVGSEFFTIFLSSEFPVKRNI